MTLFPDTELFNTGRKYRQDFNLPDAGMVLIEQFLDKSEADRYYKELLETSPWIQRKRPMYDKVVLDPRLTAYYGGDRGHAWTPLLCEIKAKVEAQCGADFITKKSFAPEGYYPI